VARVAQSPEFFIDSAAAHAVLAEFALQFYYHR